MSVMTPQQWRQLLQPINPRRVLKDGKGMNHVSQQDVTAHLTRIFGFGGFDTKVLSLECIFEDARVDPPSGEGTAESPLVVPQITHRTRWNVAYRCTFRLTIKDINGDVLATYEDGATGDAQNLVRHEAHDLAMKSAISTAKKRCAINLGDQFGLSLYNKGQMTALVMRTLLDPMFLDDEGEVVGQDSEGDDVTAGVEQQVTLGHDEIELSPEATEEQAEALARVLGATEVQAEGSIAERFDAAVKADQGE